MDNEATQTAPRELRARCCGCGNLTPLSEMTWLENTDGERLGKEHRKCPACMRSHAQCAHCDNGVLGDDYMRHVVVRSDIGTRIQHICTDCLDNSFEACGNCDCYYNADDYIDCPCMHDEEEDTMENDSGYVNPIRRIDIKNGIKKYGVSRTSGVHIKSPRMFGIEFEMVPVDESSGTASKGHTLLAKTTPEFWGVTTDASLPSNSLEVQTAPMAMKLGEDTTKEFLGSVVDSGLWKVTDRCGTHVHIDCNDIKDKYNLVRKLMASFFVFDDIFLAMQPRSRRNNRYCSPLGKDHAVRNRNNSFDKGFNMDEILKMQSTNDILHTYYKATGEALSRMMRDHYNEARYYGINFHTLFDGRGTVENRYHEGTISHSDIMQWTALNQHVVDTSRIMTDMLARRLYEIKDPTNRALAYADATKLPPYLLSYIIKRINKYK